MHKLATYELLELKAGCYVPNVQQNSFYAVKGVTYEKPPNMKYVISRALDRPLMPLKNVKLFSKVKNFFRPPDNFLNDDI